MNLFESFRIAMRALAANKLRSILTMLGIIIGVGAVIALMSIGRGVERYVTNQFAGLGSNLLFITPGQISEGPPQQRIDVRLLTLTDANALADRSRVPSVRAVAAEYSASALVARGKQSARSTVHAATATYPDVINWEVALGSFFSQADVDERARVVVLGADVYRRLFEPNEFPLEQTVRVDNLLLRVIGVMEPRGGGFGGNQDDSIFIPLTTAQDRLFGQKTVSGDYQINVIYASVIDDAAADQAQIEIGEVLRERRNISYLDSDDFNIISQDDLISVFGDILSALTIFLGAIAAISLLVGGIGIMNIMLVTVTERTREIGVRKAIGAKNRDILRQFLFEAILMSGLGGLIGVGAGIGAAKTIGRLTSFTTDLQPQSIILAMVFSAAVGVFFGYYPARRAAKLNPIEALRYE